MKKAGLVLLFVFAAIFHLSAQNDLLNLFPKQLTTSSGRTISAQTALKGKYVAVYFTASWCGPCRAFTPELVKFYKRVAKRGNLEIVMVSSDKSKKLMMDYMKKNSMPWLAVPFKDPGIAKLRKLGNVRGIPQLMILSPSGKVISRNGRWDVMLLKDRALNEWKNPNYKAKTYNDYRARNKNNKRR